MYSKLYVSFDSYTIIHNGVAEVCNLYSVHDCLSVDGSDRDDVIALFREPFDANSFIRVLSSFAYYDEVLYFD